MTTPDPQATPFTPEDPAKVTVPEVPSADFSIPDAPAVEAAAEIPAPEVPTFEPAAEIPAPEVPTFEPAAEVPVPEVPTFEPAAEVPVPEVPTFEPAAEVPVPEAPSFPQASAPSFDEATATPGSTTYGTAYDAASTQPGHDAAANQAPYGAQDGAQPGFAQPGFEQAAYAAGQQAYGQPGYSQPAYGQPGYSQPVYGQPVVAGPPKQWLVALILGLFFGGFGVHNFYLGYTNRAIIQLILTITVFGAPITGVWVLVELILILMRSGSYGYDAQGQPLQ